MMMPSIYRTGLMDDFFDGFFPDMDKAFRGNQSFALMRTDIKELDGNYELYIDMPGVKKEDVKAHIKDGYLIVTATTDSTSEEEEKGTYLRRERYSGSMSRSFYVGKEITEEDIQAKFENGILKLTIPKDKPAEVQQPKYISIEG